MNQEVFRNISKIIERDSKSTTYKFALLRGVIDIIQENSPYIQNGSTRVTIPLGLLIEKWLIYYYPILESDVIIPQINGSSKLAFQDQFKTVIDFYKTRGGLSSFYNELRTSGVANEITKAFTRLVKTMAFTIVDKPMQYIGRSITTNYYSIFTYENNKRDISKDPFNLHSIVKNFGTFTIPEDYYEAFHIIGSFLAGTDSILFKWAEFSVNASGKKLKTEKVVGEILKNPITERDVAESKKLYKGVLKEVGLIRCVWTDKLLTSYDIDHMIPFSVWKNNDLWNLLPTTAKINNEKRDKVPTSGFLESRKDLIIYYWELVKSRLETRFMDEVQISLLGNCSANNWQSDGFKQLKRTTNYLIETRGYEAWNP